MIRKKEEIGKEIAKDGIGQEEKGKNRCRKGNRLKARHYSCSRAHPR